MESNEKAQKDQKLDDEPTTKWVLKEDGKVKGIASSKEGQEILEEVREKMGSRVGNTRLYTVEQE